MSLDRQFVLRNADSVRAAWALVQANWQAAASEGRPLAIDVREHKAKRSTQANRRYWALLQQIAQDAWVDGKQYAPEVWHQHFAREFIGSEDGPKGGSYPISTTTLDSGSFAEYVTKVEVCALEQLGVELL